MRHDPKCETKKLSVALAKRLNIQSSETQTLRDEGFLCFCQERTVTGDYEPTLSDMKKLAEEAVRRLMEMRSKKITDGLAADRAAARRAGKSGKIEMKADERPDAVIILIDFEKRRRID